MQYAYEYEKNTIGIRIEDIEKYNSSYTMPDNVTSIPEVSWLDFINNMTSPVNIFEATDKVQITRPSYLMKLPFYLKLVGKRTVANYLIWRTIAELAPLLSEDIRKLDNDYRKIDESRSEHCLKLLLDNFKGLPIGIDALYVKKYRNEDTISDVDKLTQHMKYQLKSYIKKVC